MKNCSFSNKHNNNVPGRQLWLTACLLALHCLPALSEGSKDFTGYPGYRLFLDTRDDQQFKVFAAPGEFINVGASHVGISGGFIKVYRPDGTLAATFDSGTSTTAIIFNNLQEAAGPTGGGTTLGAGYVPGIVPVDPGQSGVWTVVFDFPTYEFINFENLKNNASWSRTVNQPTEPTVILAWDVTISKNAPANQGGTAVEGRLYSQELLATISQNGYKTSPSFFILTPGGFQYTASFNGLDPHRFPLSAGSAGLVSGAMQPTYASMPRNAVTRSANPDTWAPDNYYLYDPQSADYAAGGLFNHKLFFNKPDSLMPATAPVTDVVNNNSHLTWLFHLPPPTEPVMDNFHLSAADPDGNPCVANSMETGLGANLNFNASMGGIVTIQLDLNNNWSFADSVDLALEQRIAPGQNSVFWNGRNGLNQVIPPSEDFAFNYNVSLRDGEIHLLLSDVENDSGGVVLNLISNVKSAWFDQFLYNHSLVAGPVSGSDPNGSTPQPTSTPFTFQNNFGNDKLLDYWTYAYYPGVALGSLSTDIVIGCATLLIADTDQDGVRDHLDLDDDNDGVPDLLEFCHPSAGFSCLPGGKDPGQDEDLDGIANYLDANDPALAPNCQDNDGDGICDILVAAYDADGDGVPNHLDADADGDGIFDLLEAGHHQADANADGRIDGTPADFGNNGFFNAIASDPHSPNATETYQIRNLDNDLTPDFLDADRDNDGIGDALECDTPPLCADSDGDGSPDVDETDSDDDLLSDAQECPGGSACPDSDDNGTPDWQQYTCHAGNSLLHTSPISGTNILCEGDSLMLFATGDSSLNLSVSFSWTGPGGFTYSGNANASETFMFMQGDAGVLDAGTYTLQVTTPQGCASEPESFDVVVSPALQAPTFSQDEYYPCANAPFTLEVQPSGAPNLQYSWYFNGQLLGTTVAPAYTLPFVSAASNGNYTVAATNGVCESSISDAAVLSAIPVPSQAPQFNLSSSSLCEGETLTLSTNPVSGPNVIYQWNFNNGSGSVVLGSTATPSFTLPNISLSNAGLYSVTTSVNGCHPKTSLPDGVVVGGFLTQSPVLQASDLTPCLGTSLELTASAYPGVNVTYTWMANQVGGPQSLGNTTVPYFTIDSISAAQNGSYIVIASTTGGCSSLPSQVISVSVNSIIPAAPVLQATTSSLCESDPLTLTATADPLPGLQFEWFFDNGSGMSSLGSGSSNTLTMNAASLANTGQYQVQAILDGCVSALSNSEQVQVFTYPVQAPQLSSSANIHCQGETLTLNSSIYPGNNTSYAWHFDNGSGPQLLATTQVPTYFIHNLSPGDAGYYSVSVLNGGCASQLSNVQQLTVTNMAGPAMVLSVSGNKVCEAETLALNSSIFPGSSVQYRWYFDDGSGPVLLTTTDAPTLFLQDIDAADAGIYSVVASIAGCETPSSNLQAVSVTAIPDVLAENTTSETEPGCPGSGVQLSATYLQGASYQWTGPQGFAASVHNPLLPAAMPAQSGDYSALITWENCTFATAPTHVYLYDLPDAQDDQLETNLNQKLEGAELGSNDFTGNLTEWTFDLVETPSHGMATLDNGSLSYQPHPNYYGKDMLSYELCNLVCPDICDRASVEISVRGDGECFVPNIFTPNNDGTNDFFKIPCLEDTYPGNNVKVFNRWGDLVFEADDYHNNWDGRYKGNPLPPGTYFYLVQLEKGNSGRCLQGYVTLTR
jgi:gliding motility-associated-like protein